MKLLMIGDIVGRAGRRAVRELVPDLKKEKNIDFIIANAENAAGGFGLTKKVVKELNGYGIDLLTSGNHIWDNKEVFDFIDESDKVIRPYNYPPKVPGVGFKIIEKDSIKLGVINLMGRVYLDNFASPFKKADELLKKIMPKTDLILIDFHAEATSEKRALGVYLDGKVEAIVGTHTHVQTADEQILSQGTAYITDVGFSGATDSILGMDIEAPLERFLTQLPNRFKVATGTTKLSAVIIEFDETNNRAKYIERVNRIYENK